MRKSIFKLTMLHANDYFDNAEIASDRPIYRAGGNLQNFVHAMGSKIWIPLTFAHLFLCSAEEMKS